VNAEDDRPDEGDVAAMGAALMLARRALGTAWPNPAVGCVIIRDGTVVGRGWTQPGGRPHAETQALARAGAAAGGATLYASLEPCSHHGQTPPCTEAIVAAGVARVVAATEDPDPRVRGGGLDQLRAAGVRVSCGVARDEAVDLNRGYFLHRLEGRPLFTLKTAVTLDGRIATRSGDSRWITGEIARAAGHRLRAGHDAVMIGSETAIVDDPLLTCRLPGLDSRSPPRIVVDRRLRLPVTARLVATARAVPTWVVTGSPADPARRDALAAAGVLVHELAAEGEGGVTPAAVAGFLAGQGLTRVLIEGGGTIAAAWLGAGLVDRVVCFRAPRIVGGDGVPAAAAFGVTDVPAAPTFHRTHLGEAGADIVETYCARP
jgi:diaminohydroxyphosphoribosylaminopyrimidine deaminase/5-amino-6-(5-phosphoribosylamino)uracil reductase